MSWNYRVMKYKAGGVGVHEVYYDEDGTPHLWSGEPASVHGGSVDDLRFMLEKMLEGLSKPVLDYHADE